MLLTLRDTERPGNTIEWVRARRAVRARWERKTTTREPVQYTVGVAVSAVPPAELPTAASAPPEASFRRLMKKAPFSNARTISVLT